MPKREDYISWDELFMGLAILSAERSKDPNTQVGACIVNDEKRIISLGYNGFPNNISDDDFPWEREAKNELDTKYPYVCHAEQNSIQNTNNSTKDCTIYTTLFPCSNCTKLIIQAGIKKVIYLSDKYNNTNDNIAAKRMLKAAGVEFIEYKPTGKELKINL